MAARRRRGEGARELKSEKFFVFLCVKRIKVREGRKWDRERKAALLLSASLIRNSDTAANERWRFHFFFKGGGGKEGKRKSLSGF